MGEGRSFHQPGTVSENVLESDIVPLCDGITRHRSLVVPRLLEKSECKQEGAEARAVLYTSISVLNLMWAANSSHGPFWAHWKPVVLLHSESWSSKTTLRFLTELDEWGSIIQGHDCFPTIAMRIAIVYMKRGLRSDPWEVKSDEKWFCLYFGLTNYF